MFKLIKLELKDVYKAILIDAAHDDLVERVRHEKSLQIKFKGFRINKKNCSKRLIVKYMLDLYPENPKIENGIKDLWNIRVKELRNEVLSLNTRKEAEEYRDSKKSHLNLFSFSTLLMIHNKRELNLMGEEVFNEYVQELSYDIENHEKIIDKKSCEEEVCLDNNIIENQSVMDLSLGKCIDKLKNFSKELERYKNENIKKEEKIDKLNNELGEQKKIFKQQNNVMKNLISRIEALEKEVELKFKYIQDEVKNSTGSIIKQINDVKVSKDNFGGNMDKKVKNINEEISKVISLMKNINKNEQILSLKEDIKEMLQMELRNAVLQISLEIKSTSKSQQCQIDISKEEKTEKNKNDLIDPDAKELLKDLENTFVENA